MTDSNNSKLITTSFALFSIVVGFTVHVLLIAFAGAFGLVAKVIETDLMRHGLPVGIGLVLFLVLQFNPKILVWADEVVSEIKKVVWPSRKDTTAMTIVVVIMVILSSLIVTGFDFLSGTVVNWLVR